MSSPTADECRSLLNKSRATALLEDHDLDAIIATTPENVLYATGLESEGMFVFRDNEYFGVWSLGSSSAALVMPRGDIHTVIDVAPSTGEILTYGGSTIHQPGEGYTAGESEARLQAFLREPGGNYDSALEALLETLHARGLAEGRLGLDMRGVLPETEAELHRLFPRAHWEDAFPLWREIRAVKTPAEVARLSEAARANERAEEEILASIRPGIDVRTLREVFLRSLARSGAHFAYWDVGIGPESCSSFPSSAYKALPGDLVRVDTACRKRFYYSDTGRTFVLGEPDNRQLRYHEAVLRGMQEGMQMVRAGVRVSRVYDVMMAAVRATGISNHIRGGCGHGLGLEFYEVPLIRPARMAAGSKEAGDDPLFEAGMVVNLETPYYEIGFGGIQIEETLLVTADGCERITQAATNLVQC